VGLRVQLDEVGEGQHGPGGLAEHRGGHLVGIGHEAVAVGHDLPGQRLDAPKELLVLELFIAEPNERLEGHLVPEDVAAPELEDLRVHPALDEPEHLGVGAPLHLAEERPLLLAQEGEARREREPVGQQLVSRVEAPAADDVRVDVPARFLR
jgi:hypothetical protein